MSEETKQDIERLDSDKLLKKIKKNGHLINDYSELKLACIEKLRTKKPGENLLNPRSARRILKSAIEDAYCPNFTYLLVIAEFTSKAITHYKWAQNALDETRIDEVVKQQIEEQN